MLLFIILSFTVVTIISSVGIYNTGKLFAQQRGIPVVESVSEMINGDDFAEYLEDPMEVDPYYDDTRVALLYLNKRHLDFH